MVADASSRKIWAARPWPIKKSRPGMLLDVAARRPGAGDATGVRIVLRYRGGKSMLPSLPLSLPGATALAAHRSATQSATRRPLTRSLLPATPPKPLFYMVPRVGFELTTYRLRSGCSTAELPGRCGTVLAALRPPAKPPVTPATAHFYSAAALLAGNSSVPAGVVTGKLPPAAAAGRCQRSASNAPQCGHRDCHSPPSPPQLLQT
jgi:hypothetical protein